MNHQTNKFNELYDSIVANDFDNIKILVENGLDIHCENDKAFLIACYFGNLEIIEYLLNNGADINACVKANYGDNSKYSISGNGLSFAVDNSQLDVFDYLLEKGIKADLNNSLALGKIIFRKDFNRATKLIKNGANVQECNILISSIIGDHWDIVKYLVTETNINIHEREDFALRCVCHKNNFEMVKLLVEKGANINAVAVFEEGQKNNDDSNYGFNDNALTYAIFRNNWEIFNYLIEHGADPNVDNQDPFLQATALMEDYPDLKNFVKHYIEKNYVIFNDLVFEELIKSSNLDLIKFFLYDYPKKDIDEEHILDNKVIYQFDNIEIFDYFLNKRYEVSIETRNMLLEQRKDKFLQILLNYDLNNELSVSEKISKRIKV